MSRLKSLTEDRYTLNDIFIRNHEIWYLVPAVIYLLTPIIHMIVYAIFFKKLDDWSIYDYFHLMETAEQPGDYYSAIIHYAFLIGALMTIIAIIVHIIYCKKTGSKLLTADAVPLALFILYCIGIIVSTIANKTDIKYILGETSRAEGVVQVIGYYLVFYLTASLVKTEKYKKFIIWFFLATGTFIGILTLINEYIKDITIIGDAYVCGIFYTHNFYAYYLCISILLCAGLFALDESKKAKIAAFVIMCMNTYILAINDSLGPFLASIVAFVFLFAAVTYKKKKFSVSVTALFIVFIGIIFVTGLFTPSFFSEFISLGRDVKKIVTNTDDAGNAGTLRWTLWTHTAKYIKEKPYVGWGIEGTAERLGTETHADKAHNEYLENMAYYGIAAGAIYVIGLMAIYIKALIKRAKIDGTTVICLAGALAYIGSALVGNSFIFTAPFFFIFLGLANNTDGQYVKIIKEAEEPEEPQESVNENTEEALESESEETTENTEAPEEEVSEAEAVEAVINEEE